jgi:diguanylate cyclase (GGDEF)-like protein
MIVLEGRADGPLVICLVGPLGFVAMTQPPRALVLTTLPTLALYAGVAVFGDPGPAGYAPVQAGVLVTLLVAWSARRSAMRRDEEALRRLTRTDSLTGCLNRRGFGDLVDAAIAAGEPFALLAFDVDGLKAVNDEHGHDAGDVLLREVAEAIGDAMADAPHETGRIGGDEFAALVPLDVAPDIAALAARLDGVPVSVGEAIFPADGGDAGALYARADAAMYSAKRAASAPTIRAAGVARQPGPTAIEERAAHGRGGLRTTAQIHLAGFAMTEAYGLATAHWAIAALAGTGGVAAAGLHVFAGRVRAHPAVRVVYTLFVFAVTFAFLVLDGGPGEPVTSGFILAPMAVAMTARPREVLAMGALLVAAFGGVVAVTDAGPSGYSAVMVIVTACAAASCCAQQSELAAQRRRLVRLARTDALTGCLNRRGLQEQLRTAVAGAAAKPVALLSIDLDDFKEVNDTHGHAAGDELLVWVAGALGGCLRGGDVVARTGGDEFAAVVAATSLHEALVTAEGIESVLAERTRVSIGVAACPRDAGDATRLERIADARMYARKRDRAGVPAL